MTPQEELAGLRRLAELEDKAAGKSAPAPKEEPPTDWLRKIALGGRAAFEGALALPMMGADVMSGGPLKRAVGDPTPSPMEQVKSLLDEATYSPETKDERLLTDVVGGATGALGAGGPLRAAAGALTAGGASGLASGLTREAGGNQLWQILAGLGGGIAPAAAKGLVGGIGDKVADVAATVGAGFGHKGSIKRLAEDAAERTSGAERDFIRAAEKNATTFVPGAKPTTAEAIAQRNQMTQDVRGGSTVKLQQDLTGATGAEGILPSVAKRQNSAVLNAAAPFAGGATRKEQDAAQKIADQILEQTTRPMREQALKDANIGGVLAPKLTAEAENLAAAAAQKVQRVRDMSAAADRAENMGTEFGRRTPATALGSPTGMPSAGKAHSYGQELSGRAEDVASKAAEASLRLGEGAKFAKYQADSLAAHGYFPLKTEGITGKIDEILATPGKRASDVVDMTLNETKAKIAKFTNENGVIDSRDLATIRNEIGSTIKKFAGENKNWDQRLAAGLETTIKKQLDSAIESAGGTGWTDYLKTYGRLAKEKDKLVVGQAIMDKLRNEKGDLTPVSVLNVLGRGEDALLKTKSGMQRDVGGLEGLYGKDYGKIENIVEHLTRQAEVKRIGGEVKGSNAANMAGSDIPTLPNLLSRPAMVANYALKVLGKGANEPVAREISKRFADGTYGELLKRPPSDPARKVIEAMIRASTATAVNQEVQP